MTTHSEVIEQMGGIIEQLNARVEELEADNTRAWMQVEAITRERDELRQRPEKELLGVYRERDALRAALKRYATHLYSCDWDTVHAVCTCGLVAALEMKEEPGSQ